MTTFFSLSAQIYPGFFTQISTLADVQENVMEYLHVLSRPKVIDQEHDVVWTEAYVDSTVSLQEAMSDKSCLYVKYQIILFQCCNTFSVILLVVVFKCGLCKCC